MRDLDEGPTSRPPTRRRVVEVPALAKPSLANRVAACLVIGLGFVGMVGSDLAPGRVPKRTRSIEAPIGSTSVGPDVFAWHDAYLDEGGYKRTVFVVEGEFAPGSADRVEKYLKQEGAAPGDLVTLSSPGGIVEEAIMMGRRVRYMNLHTVVATFDPKVRFRSADCASACVFAFAGGVRRWLEPGSRLGVHQFVSMGADESAVDATASAQETAAMIVDYLDDMGVSGRFLSRMVEGKDVTWLTEAEEASLDLIRR